MPWEYTMEMKPQTLAEKASFMLVTQTEKKCFNNIRRKRWNESYSSENRELCQANISLCERNDVTGSWTKDTVGSLLYWWDSHNRDRNKWYLSAEMCMSSGVCLCVTASKSATHSGSERGFRELISDRRTGHQQRLVIHTQIEETEKKRRYWGRRKDGSQSKNKLDLRRHMKRLRNNLNEWKDLFHKLLTMLKESLKQTYDSFESTTAIIYSKQLRSCPGCSWILKQGKLEF